jgi:hypothetical protein
MIEFQLEWSTQGNYRVLVVMAAEWRYSEYRFPQHLQSKNSFEMNS